MKIKSVRKMMESSFHAVSNGSFHRSPSMEHVELGSDSEDEFGGDGEDNDKERLIDNDNDNERSNDSESSFVFLLGSEEEAMPMPIAPLERQTTPSMDHWNVEDSSKSSSHSSRSPRSPTSILDSIDASSVALPSQAPSSSLEKPKATNPILKAQSIRSLFVDNNNHDEDISKGGNNPSETESDKNLKKTLSSSPEPSSRRKTGASARKSKSLVGPSMAEEMQPKSGRTRRMGRKPKSMRNLTCNQDDPRPKLDEVQGTATTSRRKRGDGMKVKSNSLRGLKGLGSDKDDHDEANEDNHSTHVHSGGSEPLRPKLVSRQNRIGLMRKAQSMRSLIDSSSDTDHEEEPMPRLCRSSSLTGPPPPKDATPKFRRVKSLSTDDHIDIIRNSDKDITTCSAPAPSSSGGRKRDGLMRKSKSARGLKCTGSSNADDSLIASSLTQKKGRGRDVVMKKANSMRALTITDEGGLIGGAKVDSLTLLSLAERRSSDPASGEKRSNDLSPTDEKKPASLTSSSNNNTSKTAREVRKRGYRRSKSMNMVISCDADGFDHVASNLAAKTEDSTPPVPRSRPSLASHLAEDEATKKGKRDIALQKCNTDPNISRRSRRRKSSARVSRSGGKGKAGQKSTSSNSGGQTSNSDNHRSLKGLKDIRNRLGQSPRTSQMIPSHEDSNQSVASGSYNGGSISSLTMSSRMLTQDDFSISSSQRSPFRRAFSSPRLFADASIEEDDETSCGDLEEHPTTCRWDALPPRKSTTTDTLPIAPDHDLSTVGDASVALFESRRSSQARWSTETRNGSGSIRKKLGADSKPVQPNHDTSSYCGSAIQPWDGSDVHIPGTPSYSVASSFAGRISELTPATCMGDSSRDRYRPIKSQSSLQAKFRRDEEKRNVGAWKSSLSGLLLHSEHVLHAAGSDGSSTNKKKDGAPRMVRRHSLDSASHCSFDYNEQVLVLQQALENGLASNVIVDESENDNAPKIPSRRTSTGSSVYYIPSDDHAVASGGVSTTIPEE